MAERKTESVIVSIAIDEVDETSALLIIGKREFDDVTKAKLAKFFGVTVQWLFFDQRYCKMQSNPNNPDSAA